MTYTEIFDDVVSIMKNDSSTCRDIPGDDPAPYREKITPDMTSEVFGRLVREYLISFGIRGHLEFYSEKRLETSGNMPIDVERYENALYITRTSPGTAFAPGDRIVALDGLSIEETARKYERYLCGEAPERQGFYWRFFLKEFSTCTVIRKADGTRAELPLEKADEPVPSRDLTYEKLDGETVYLYLPHFTKKDCVKDLIAPHKKELRQCRYLIIDVRGNIGGNSGEYRCLFRYCFPKGNKKYPIGVNQGREMNYTERNCALKREAMLKYGYSPKTVERIMKKSGKGFVREEFSPERICGRKTPEKVFLLTDDRCASAGDSLSAELRCSPKVTVVGRPTAGANDYSNCCVQRYGDFSLQYPMSRSLLIDRGEGKLHRGEPVDVYIPWTPEHIERDVDLERVREMLKY